MNDASPASGSVNAEPPAMVQPFRNAPAFWAQHDGYMKQLEKINQESKDMGIEWNVGIELEFRLDPVEELHHFKHQAIKQATTYFPSETFGTWEEWNARQPMAYYKHQRFKTHKKLEDLHEFKIRQIAKDLLISTSEKYLQKTYGDDFHETLNSMPSSELVDLWYTRRDIMLPALETAGDEKADLLRITLDDNLTLAEAIEDTYLMRSNDPRRIFMRHLKDGLFSHDSAEPYFYNEGYSNLSIELPNEDLKKNLKKDRDYDAKEVSIMEFRFHHTDPTTAVNRFYEVVNRAKQEANRMGFQLNIRPNIHFHISAHDIETGKSITSGKEKHLDDYRAIVEGVAQSLEDGRCLYNHGIELETPTIGAIPGKNTAINPGNKRFEMRTGDIYPPQPEKYLAMALSGAIHGLKHKEETLENGRTTISKLAIPKAFAEVFEVPFWLREGSSGIDDAYLEPIIADCRSYHWQQLHMYNKFFTGKDGLDPSLIPGHPAFSPSLKKGLLKNIAHLPVTFHSGGINKNGEITNGIYRLRGENIPAEYRTSKYLEDGMFETFEVIERPPVEPAKGQGAVDKLKNSAIFNEQWDQELLDATVAIAQEREKEQSQSRGR